MCCLLKAIALLYLFPAGVFWESGVQARWIEAVPNAGDPRYGSVRVVENGPVQELHTQRLGGPGGQNSGTGAAMDSSLPGAEVRQSIED